MVARGKARGLGEVSAEAAPSGHAQDEAAEGSGAAAPIEVAEPPPAADAFRSPIEDVLQNRVLAQHALTLAGNYFEILGLPERATRDEVVEAHASLSAAFSDDALPADLVREHAARLHEIREVLAEAARLMANDALRARYRAHAPPAVDGPKPRAE